jgi:hypothetical protein
LATGFGIVFVVALFGVAIWLVVIDREPPQAAMFFFRVILALAAAGVGAFLPGLLNVTINGNGLVVSATAGLALFLLIFFVNPPAVIGKARPPEVGPLKPGKRDPQDP